MTSLATKELACVVALARSGSFTAAGATLSMTQQGVSRLVARLEARAGVRLFERTTRRVRLTEDGEAFLELADAADSAVRAASRWLDARTGGPVRTVRIGYTVSLARFVVERLAPALAAGGWLADCVEMPSAVQETEVRDGRLELAFLHPPLAERALRTLPLGSEPLVVVLPAVHPLAGRDSIALAELAHERWWLFDPHQGPWLHGRVHEALRDALSGAEPRVEAHVMPHSARADAAVRAGGVTVMSRSAVASMHEPAAFATCEGLRLEAAAAWQPGSTSTGRDAALELTERLRDLAPPIVVG